MYGECFRYPRMRRRQFFGGSDDVGEPRVDRAARHAVELRRLERLHEAAPPFLLDGPKAERAVRAHPREMTPILRSC